MSVGSSRVVGMFDSLVGEPLNLMTGSQLAAAISDNHAELLARECRVLELACAWADLHTREPVEYAPLVERARFFGGPGTPAILGVLCGRARHVAGDGSDGGAGVAGRCAGPAVPAAAAVAAG
jgi:hypothetical protein